MSKMKHRCWADTKGYGPKGVQGHCHNSVPTTSDYCHLHRLPEPDVTVKLKLHPVIVRAVDKLLATGMYGTTREEAVDRLLCRQIGEHAADELEAVKRLYRGLR